jgi:hypothetical protein
MNKKVWILGIGLLIGCIAAAIVCYATAEPQSPINGENAARIQVGMTLAEVEQLLGGPARDESSGKLASVCDESEFSELTVHFFKHPPVFCSAGMTIFLNNGKEAHSFPILWVSDRLIVRVFLDTEGHVEFSESMPVFCADEHPIRALVRRWLHRSL